MKRYLPFAIIGGVVVLVVVGAFALYRSNRADPSAPFSAGANPTPPSQALGPVPPPGQAPAPGPSVDPVPVVPQPSNVPAGVSVTIEEFGDYQCPPCGLLHPELKKIAAEYGGKVKIVFRNFPLTMNHKNAQAAAEAAEAARLQGHFDEMHDRIYETQDAWKDLADPRPTFARYAREMGLDAKRYSEDLQSSVVEQKIEFDKETAIARGVNSTPTVFIDGQQLKPELTNLEGLRSGINIMLTRKVGRP